MKINRQKKIRFLSFILFLTFLLLPLNILKVFADEAAFEQSISAFPDGYKTYLRQLHTKYPNWEFEALVTNVDWNTAVAAESSGNRSLVPASSASRLLKSMNSGDYDYNAGTYLQKDSGWVTASPIAVSYFMDPRNFLNETYIFQFEMLSYDAAAQTRTAVESILSGTFMSQSNGTISYLDAGGNTIPTGEYYSDIIIEAATTYNINPCYLASKIRQEIGTTKSGSVTGNYSYNGVSYTGLYNYYNIGANDSASGGAIANGLTWANTGETYGRPWTSPRKSIIGGARYIAEKYINCGQSTQYLQKFNVNPNATNPLYSHQYMTNVSGSASAATTTYNSYNNIGVLSDSKKFLIPVFNNMPDGTATAMTLNNATGVGTINGSSVNVRSGPGTQYGTTGVQLSKNTQVTILNGVRNDTTYYYNQLLYPFWYYISFTSGSVTKYGYVCEDYIDVTSSVTLSAGNTYNLGYTVTSSGSADKPMFMSLDSRIATVDSNGKVTAIGTVKLDDGREINTARVVAYTAKGSFCVLNVVIGSSSSGTGDTPSGDPSSNAISSSNYTVASGFISGISAGTTAQTLLAKINEGSSAQIYNGSTAVSGSSLIGTGMTVRNGTASVQIVVIGDTNGDGKITVTDMLAIKKDILGTKLGSAYKQAADLSGDGLVSITDFIKIKYILLHS